MQGTETITQRQTSRWASVAPLVLLFALHTFLLMGTGTWSDMTMASESIAATFYYAREGVLAAGFLLFAALAHLRHTRPLSPKSIGVLLVAALVVFGVCVVTLLAFDQLAVRVVALLVIALVIGMSGGMVYERIALMAQQVTESGVFDKPQMRDALRGDSTRVLGIVVGGGGAIAVLLHYVLQIVFSLGIWLPVCFVVCFGALVWFVGRLRSDYPACPGERPKGSVSAVSFACMVVAAGCLFALLLFYEVVLRGAGAVAYFYEWHRLITAVGYIAIGALAYAGGRPAASTAVLVAGLFAVVVLMQTVMLEAGPVTAVLYYALLGAIIAWSGIVFMAAAAQSSHPALVASMGRVLSAIVTAAGAFVPADAALPMMTVLVSALILLALIVVSMVKGGFLVFPEHGARAAEPPREEDSPSPEERVSALAREHGLTAREQEVFAALVLTEKKNQQIADDLGISRRQLQTHISHIYEKTGTATRAGLVMRANGDTVNV